MDIEKELYGRLGQKKAQKLASFIIKDTSLKPLILAGLKHKDDAISKNTAWLLTHVHDCDKSYFEDSICELIEHIGKSNLDGVIRGILRCLQDYSIPIKKQGSLISSCFELLTDNNRPIAVKVFAMTIVYNHCEVYPELKRELKIVIEDLMSTNSPGIISRGSKILKRIS